MTTVSLDCRDGIHAPACQTCDCGCHHPVPAGSYLAPQPVPRQETGITAWVSRSRRGELIPLVVSTVGLIVCLALSIVAVTL